MTIESADKLGVSRQAVSKYQKNANKNNQQNMLR